MKRFYRLIKKIKNRKWEEVNTDHLNSLGVTIYNGPDKLLFGYFDRATLMEGFFSSITFSGRLPDPSEMDLPRAEELYEFIDSFFTSKAKGIKGLCPELFAKRYLKMQSEVKVMKKVSDCTSTEIMEFIEENTAWRVLLVIVPKTGDIRLSFTDHEEKGIYLPIYGYIDALYVRTKDFTPYCKDKVTILTKRSFLGKVSSANNSRNYEFLFGGLIKNKTTEQVAALSLERHYSVFSTLLALMQSLYGMDVYGHCCSKDELFLDQTDIPESRHTTLCWILPEADIIIKPGFRKVVSPGHGLNGYAFLKIEVTPRLFIEGDGQDWVFDRLSERRSGEIHI